MRIEKNNTALLIIDIQERLFPVIAEKEELLEACKKLVAGAGVLALPTLVTQQYTKGLGETLPEIMKLIEGFEPIEKTSFSCYDEPAFVEKLEETGKKNIVICGIESHVCVLQTAVDLKAAGYNPIVVFDCVSSRTLLNKKYAFKRFSYEGIMTATYESVLFEMTKGAKTPEFKAISKIVK